MASISRTAQGRWKARYRDTHGRSRSRTFDTKYAASRFLEVAGAEMQRGTWVDPAHGRITFGRWCEEFMATVVNLRPTTRATYERDLERYVLPRFGASQLSRITPLDVRAWIAEELATGLAPSSVHRHFRTLRRVLNVAVESELIAKSPCVGVKPPAMESPEMKFLTAAEVQELAEAIGPQFRVLIFVAAYAGLRWAELIGLKRSRVDLLGRSIAVVEQLVTFNNQSVWQPPKTKASRRKVSISPFLVDMLNHQLATRSLPGPDGLVFPNQAGKPISPASFNGNHWRRAIQKTDLEGLRFHDLRHTAVALAIAQGAHPKAIQARMGHNSVQMTLDRYGHLFPELDAQIAVGLDDVYRASIVALPRASVSALEDTRRTQRTRGGHKIVASDRA